MLPILVGLGSVCLASFLLMFAVWSTGKPQENHHWALDFLFSFLVMLGSVLGGVVTLLLGPDLPEEYRSMMIPLMIPAIFFPWLASGFGCAVGDMVWSARKERK